MILGIGTDLVNITRIEQVFQKFPNAYHKKILSADELTKFEKMTHRHKKIKFLATRWAVKEAFVKALGTGFRNGMYFPQISVINNSLGKPNLSLSSQAANIIHNIFHQKTINVHISLSDDDQNAVAFVIIENI